jgi:hypothetical protein
LSGGSPSKSRFSITFKVFSLIDYPNGDNRIFTIHGSHTFSDVMARINEKYAYLTPVIPLYKNKTDEIVTIDTNEVYDKILYEVFGQSYAREAEIKIYVKPLNSHANTSVFGSMIRKGSRP